MIKVKVLGYSLHPVIYCSVWLYILPQFIGSVHSWFHLNSLAAQWWQKHNLQCHHFLFWYHSLLIVYKDVVDWTGLTQSPHYWQPQPWFKPLILWSWYIWQFSQLCHSGHNSSWPTLIRSLPYWSDSVGFGSHSIEVTSACVNLHPKLIPQEDI